MDSLESIFANPAEVADQVTATMREAHEKGELSDGELEKMVSATQRPPPRTPLYAKRGVFVPRGEGGSGERRQVTPVPPVTQSKPPSAVSSIRQAMDSLLPFQAPPASLPTDSKPPPNSSSSSERGDSAGEPGDEEELEGDLAGGDVEAEKADVGRSLTTPSVADPPYFSASPEPMNPHMRELKEFMEDQFTNMNAMVRELTERITRLENRPLEAVRRPINFMPDRRVSTDLGRKPSSPPGKGKNGPPSPLTSVGGVSREKVIWFLKGEPGYPSLPVIRQGKMRALQASMGLVPQVVDLQRNEWNEEGVYTKLVTLHEGG